MAYDFFYDEQLRRYLLQIVRAFSGFQYEMGRTSPSDPPERRVVPCRLASQNRHAATIMRNNSENTVLSVPAITVWIKEISLARDRTQAPGFVSSVQVTERKFDSAAGEYTSESGNQYTVERMMPHPVDITIQVDLWTSNEMQKHQIWEQVMMMFNVGFSIQSSDNPLDWTSLTDMTMESIQWTSRSIPVGTGDEIDIASFVFKLPIFINPPAKVLQQRLVEQIRMNLTGGSFSREESIDGIDVVSHHTPFAHAIVTPDMAQVEVTKSPSGYVVKLLGSNGSNQDASGNPLVWRDLIAKYGELRPAISELRLHSDLDSDESLDVIGTIQYHPTDENLLLWQPDIDTIPSSSIPNVTAVIDPMVHLPGVQLDPPSNGQRYLVLNDMGVSTAWGISSLPVGATTFAKTGDIIERISGQWQVVFSAASHTSIEYTINLRNSKLLKFIGGEWIIAVEGTYNVGYWRMKL